MTRKTDVALSAGTLTLVFFTAGLLAETGILDEFGAWAWERHHNALSWYIRPLFLLPFCWFAYKRSFLDIVLTVVALATSMFWFPAPEQPGAGALEYLAMEREYLTGDWTVAKILLGLLAPLSFAGLALAFWKRSVVYGLVLINAMVLIRIAWSFYFGDESGGLTQLPSAIVGLAVCDVVVLYLMRRLRRRSSEPSRPAGHYG